VEHGEAVTVPCEDGFVHYDANTKPHLHFQCRRCKCLIDITNPSDNEILENLGANVSSHFPGKIEAGSVCFYGLCEKFRHAPQERKGFYKLFQDLCLENHF